MQTTVPLDGLVREVRRRHNEVGRGGVQVHPVDPFGDPHHQVGGQQDRVNSRAADQSTQVLRPEVGIAEVDVGEPPVRGDRDALGAQGILPSVRCGGLLVIAIVTRSQQRQMETRSAVR